jgi:hypothetical protein
LSLKAASAVYRLLGCFASKELGFAEERPDIRVDENFMAIISSSKETDGSRSRCELLSKPDSDLPACRSNWGSMPREIVVNHLFLFGIKVSGFSATLFEPPTNCQGDYDLESKNRLIRRMLLSDKPSMKLAAGLRRRRRQLGLFPADCEPNSVDTSSVRNA